jgi:hypothetical protein
LEKRVRNLRKRIPKNEAIIHKALKNGSTFADVIRKTKEAVPNLEELGIEVVGARRTAAGDILLEVGSKKEAEIFAKKLEKKLGNKMSVRRPTRTAPVLISGLDESITAEELRVVFAKRDPELADIKLFNIQTAAWSTAKIEAPIVLALWLAADPKKKVGWSTYRIKLIGEKKRVCFRCLETGHVSAGCQEEDRSNCCLKCKKNGHVAKYCEMRTTTRSTQRNEAGTPNRPGGDD